jgi:hypothetical protein
MNTHWVHLTSNITRLDWELRATVKQAIEAADVRVTRSDFEYGKMRLDVEVESDSRDAAEARALAEAEGAIGGAGWEIIGSGEWPAAAASPPEDSEHTP